ncbi:hypothetical protein AVEN_113024-1 [Araneus ventricosus]|uniref:Uncharacterized protein n=1 Tax=Araneus ventricosus TaxID=182803 RepID=A0A4Y2RQM1_ARAVE|nr:hypothetical protein AVEN_113024-1 [Araneus ventricosus]
MEIDFPQKLTQMRAVDSKNPSSLQPSRKPPPRKRHHAMMKSIINYLVPIRIMEIDFPLKNHNESCPISKTHIPQPIPGDHSGRKITPRVRNQSHLTP